MPNRLEGDIAKKTGSIDEGKIHKIEATVIIDIEINNGWVDIDDIKLEKIKKLRIR